MVLLTKKDAQLLAKYQEDFSRMMNYEFIIHAGPGRASPFFCSYCLCHYNLSDIDIMWITENRVTRLYSWECPTCRTIMFPRFITQYEREQSQKEK